MSTPRTIAGDELRTTRTMPQKTAEAHLSAVCKWYSDAAPEEGWGPRKEWTMHDGSWVSYDPGRGFTAHAPAVVACSYCGRLHETTEQIDACVEEREGLAKLLEHG